MSEDPNLLPEAHYGQLAFDHFLLVQPSPPLFGVKRHELSRDILGQVYLQLGSKGREIYHKIAAACSWPLMQSQIDTLKAFLTNPQRNLSAEVAQYGKVLLFRTCYEKGTDAAFAMVLSKYSTVNFASVCDDKDNYNWSNSHAILQRLPFLVERAKFARCSLMPRERQDRIISLGPNIDCLRKNKAEVDRLLLMDNIHPSNEILSTLAPSDVQRWSSIVGVICLADEKTMECGLIKLYAFDDQGETIWCTRISPEGLGRFTAGLGEGKSVFELRLALRLYETGHGRCHSASELSDKPMPLPSSTYDRVTLIAEKGQADREKGGRLSEDAQPLNTSQAGDKEAKAGELKVNNCDDVHRLQKELLESREAQHVLTVELDKAVAREREASAEGSLAEQARREACDIVQRSNNAREKAEADLCVAEQRRAELAMKIEAVRADYCQQLLDCAAARSWALEERDVAVLEKLDLAKDLAQERVKVASMEKALDAKDCVIADSKDNENRIAQRLREEIMAKEKAEDAENVPKITLSQVLDDTDREISNLKDQLVREQSAAISKAEEKDLLAKQLALEVSTNKELAQKSGQLEKELQKVKKELLGTKKLLDEEVDLLAKHEDEVGPELKKRKEMIEALEEANCTLHEQVESEREAHTTLQGNYGAAQVELCVAKKARIQAERDLQNQNAHHNKEIQQATQAKEEALKGMVSMKKHLERKLSEWAALELRLKLECGKTRSEFARSVRVHEELEQIRERERDQLSALLQKALVERDQATKDSTESKDHLGTMYQRELEAKVKAERRCQELHLKAVQSAQVLAKMEKDMCEREALLVRRLQSMDLGFRDELAKREQVEEELSTWQCQHGVIALD